ncbi:MAG: glycosyltransferase family 2 protein, partial [Phycisphaerae bacterium]
GDIVVIQDADLEYNPEDYNFLLKPILDDRADVVYGSRFRGGAAHRVDRFWHTVGNKVVTLLSNMFTDLNLTDMETCYKVFRSEVLEGLTFRSNGFDFEPEFTAKVAKRRKRGGRWRVYEVGISYAGRGRDEGKKISWLDGLPALFAIIRYRFFD